MNGSSLWTAASSRVKTLEVFSIVVSVSGLPCYFDCLGSCGCTLVLVVVGFVVVAKSVVPTWLFL